MLRHAGGLHGVFLGSSAVSEGWASARQLKSGVYRRLLHNVYATRALPVDHQLHARAAMLLIPHDAALGGATAAAWYGAPFAATSSPVCVVVPRGSAWRGPRGVRVHRTDLSPSDVRTVENAHELVRITTPLRTAWDVATLEPLFDAVALLDGMARGEAIDREGLDRLLAGAAGRWRAGRVRRAVPLVDGRAQSPPESWVRVACALAGLPAPVPQFHAFVDGEKVGEVDLAWPDQKVIVEYEGPHHFEGVQISKDDRRYARLIAAGWTVIRVGASEIRDMKAVVATIAAALGATAGGF